MKHLIILLLIVSFPMMTFANDSIVETVVEEINPDNHLDTHIPKAPEALPTTVFGIQIHQDVQIASADPNAGNFFGNLGLSGININTVLSLLANASVASHVVGPSGHFYSHPTNDFSQSVSNFQSDLGNFLQGFPQAGELLTMQLNSGESSFVNEVGQTFSADPENYYNEEQTFTSTDIILYAGRFTTLNTPTDYGQGVPSNATSLMTVFVGNNKYEISAFHSTTPIVLDMDGDQKLEASNGVWLPHQISADATLVEFDLNGDGFDELIEWVGPNDGILVRYDGGVMNGFNMFGSPGGFGNGFEKLSAFDQNNDKKLSGQELGGLSVWQDKNGNTKVDSGEIRSLSDLNITEIGLNHQYLTSYFVQNGEKKILWDWHPATQMVKKMRK